MGLMKRSYEYGFIDGSIILSRNFYAMKPLLSQERYGSEYLVKSVLCSIFKLAREVLDCERYFILWDKKPYWKTEFLKTDVGKSEYKTDRRKETDYLVKKLGQAKLSLLCNGDNLGLTQVQYVGWEADDLAYLASQQCLGRNKKSVLISFDSDWISWISPNVDYYNIRRDEIFTFDHVMRFYPPIKGLDLFWSKAWRDSMKGSHNNLKLTLKPEYKSTKSIEIIDAYNRGDYHHFADIDLFNAQFRTFDFKSYPDYDKVSQFLKDAEKRGKLAPLEEFRSIRQRLGLNPQQLKSELYLSYLRSININKW